MQGKLLWNFTSTKLHSTHTPNPVFSVTDIQPKENKFWRKENLGYFKAMWRMNWHKRCPTGAYKYRSRILSEISHCISGNISCSEWNKNTINRCSMIWCLISHHSANQIRYTSYYLHLYANNFNKNFTIYVLPKSGSRIQLKHWIIDSCE